MEQQLIDVLEKANSPDDIDYVSQAMIMARVIDSLEQVRELTEQYLKDLASIQKEHEFELKLGGLTIVLNVTDSIANKVHDGITQAYVLGPRDKVLKNISQIMEKV